MKIIIDTNTIISIIPRNSKYNSIFVYLIKGKYSITITTEINLEYEEILLWRSNPIVAKAFFDFLVNSKQVETITVSYYWRLITVDPDDNKFVDAAIAAGADYIVTEDGHFDVLKNIPFPPNKSD